MQEDTKPKNDDVQDTEQKKPLTRSEYHGVITSYAGLALSLIAIILSVITMYQSHTMETREIVQILRAEDDGYYHFDGKKLFKNYQVTVANNSAIPVSVVEITIELDGELRNFSFSNISDVLPLNMEANQTNVITIPWIISLHEQEIAKIKEAMNLSQKPEKEVTISSKCIKHVTLILEEDEVFVPEWIRIDALFPREILDNSPPSFLSVTLHTGKDNQYVFTTEDTVSLHLSVGLGTDEMRNSMSMAERGYDLSKSVSEGKLVSILMRSQLLATPTPPQEMPEWELVERVQSVLANQEEE